MNNNFVIYGEVEKDFTKVPNTIIRDTSISAEARIILEFLINLTGDFNIYESGLSSILGISLFKVKRAVIELENAGYIHREKQRNSAMQFAGWSWKISAVPIFMSKKPLSENPLSENPLSDNPLSENPLSEKPLSENQPYIKDRKDIRPTDTRLKEDKTKVEEIEESVSTPTLTSLFQSEETIISSGEINTIQAFNRFCEVYPRIGDREQAQAAFFQIPDISNICWKIVQSVEWFENLKRWDDWQTGQKHKYCPQAIKFLKRGDWQEYMKSGADMSRRERLAALLPDEEDEYETN